MILSPLYSAFLQSSRAPPDSFVAITAHGVTNSPVVYLPPRGPEKSSSKSTAAPLNPPAHLPKKDGEDTWCLVLAPDEERKDVKNVLYESVGQWDARWG
jgi:ribonuclease P/MRP protein subunit RPP40